MLIHLLPLLFGSGCCLHWLWHRSRCWHCRLRWAGWLSSEGVAGALPASAALTEPRPGGLAGPLECGSCQALSPKLPCSVPVELPPPPSCPGQALPTGARHHIHCAHRLLRSSYYVPGATGTKRKLSGSLHAFTMEERVPA